MKNNKDVANLRYSRRCYLWYSFDGREKPLFKSIQRVQLEGPCLYMIETRHASSFTLTVTNPDHVGQGGGTH